MAAQVNMAKRIDSRLINMTNDQTAPPLIGCTVQLADQPDDDLHNFIDFCRMKGVFLTESYLFGFYINKQSYQGVHGLRLARFDFASNTWLQSPCFTRHLLGIKDDSENNSELLVVPLPWEESEFCTIKYYKVLLLLENRASLLMLTVSQVNGVWTRMTEIDLMQISAQLPNPSPDQPPNVRWMTAAVDCAARAVYLVGNMSVENMARKLELFKLEWNSNGGFLWNRQILFDETGAEGFLDKGEFLALHDGHLYNGSLHKNNQYPLETDIKLQIINLQTMAIVKREIIAALYPISNAPNTCEISISSVQFCSLGGTVYALDALISKYQSRIVSVVKNQLWALSLSTLEVRKIEDAEEAEEAGETPEPSSRARQTHFAMRNFYLAAAPGGSKLWAVSADYQANYPKQKTKNRSFKK